MLDTNDFLFDFENEDESLLHMALEKYFKGYEPHNERLTINSKLIDIAKFFGSMEEFETEYDERKRIAPNWEMALQKWIEEIENRDLGSHTRLTMSYGGEPYPVDYFNKPSVRTAYDDITGGKNDYLYKYTPFFIDFHEDNKLIVSLESTLKEFARGVALAYKLPKFKEELKQIKDFGQNTPSELQPIKQRLNWTGTAGEFAAIIDILIEKGFIEDIPQKNNKAKLCLELFNIKSQKTGQPIAETTLRECFGKDKYNFLPNEIKIPQSITYGKER